MNMNTEEQIAILYNARYGGFGISQKAIDEYNKRKLIINPNEEILDKCCSDWVDRADNLMCQLYTEMGNEFNDKYSKIKIKYIPKRYENHYIIDECDGLENISINYSTYALDEIKKVVDNTEMTNDAKINLIRDMYYINMHNDYSSKS